MYKQRENRKYYIKITNLSFPSKYGWVKIFLFAGSVFDEGSIVFWAKLKIVYSLKHISKIFISSYSLPVWVNRTWFIICESKIMRTARVFRWTLLRSIVSKISISSVFFLIRYVTINFIYNINLLKFRIKTSLLCNYNQNRWNTIKTIQNISFKNKCQIVKSCPVPEHTITHLLLRWTKFIYVGSDEARLLTLAPSTPKR